jgi:Crinkler effector protein N-terminal domain
MPTQLKLFVFVIALDNPSPFSVRIPDSESVHDLKEAILKKIQDDLKHVPAYRLKLWKVSILSRHDLRERASRKLAELKDNKDYPLDPAEELSECFNAEYWDNTERTRTVHVLVELPKRESFLSFPEI